MTNPKAIVYSAQIRQIEDLPHGERVLRWPIVHERSGLCRSHVHDLVKKGKFPAPIKLGGGRASGWLESEVNTWISERVAESRNQGGQ